MSSRHASLSKACTQRIRGGLWMEEAGTYWERDALCARVHALHVHVRTEQEDATGVLPVCLHAFKDGLGVV
jgi:hypothetical protein